MTDKQYAGNAKSVDGQYGKFLKISMTEEDVNTLLKNLKDGWVNVTVKKRREPSEKGFSHYLEVDLWSPEKKEEKKEDSENLPF